MSSLLNHDTTNTMKQAHLELSCIPTKDHSHDESADASSSTRVCDFCTQVSSPFPEPCLVKLFILAICMVQRCHFQIPRLALLKLYAELALRLRYR